MAPYAIVTGDFVRTGGMDAANYALASYLGRSGRPVRLVAYRAAPELLENPNVVLRRVPKPAGAYLLGGPLLGVEGFLEGRSVARLGGHVVVNGGNCFFPGANWVHYVHAAFEPVATGWRAAKARAQHRASLMVERIALRRATIVIANSERTRSDVVDRVGVPADRVRVVYYGIDASRFRPSSADERATSRTALGWKGARPRVAFVGALGDRRKGFDVVYDAWRGLCASESWDAELVVVGTGAELPAWRARAARDGIAGRVEFLGFRTDVPRILAACDALVSPTRYEAYGLGVHEALCCGLPALVSAAAGVAERYPPSLARLLLADPEDASAVSASLTHWRANAADLRAGTLVFSEHLRKRSWDDMAGDIVALCDSAEAAGRPSTSA